MVEPQDEFFEFSRDMVKSGPDAFFSRIGRSAFVNTMILPGASFGIKRVNNIPDVNRQWHIHRILV